MIDRMIAEYGEPMVRALVDTIAEKTEASYIESAEIVLAAWQRSKGAWIAESRTFRRYRQAETIAVQ
jgi:hypothetical protein